MRHVIAGLALLLAAGSAFADDFNAEDLATSPTFNAEALESAPDQGQVVDPAANVEPGSDQLNVEDVNLWRFLGCVTGLHHARRLAHHYGYPVFRMRYSAVRCGLRELACYGRHHHRRY